MDLIDSLHRSLLVEGPVRPGDGLVVAFSGGTDSTALLWGLSRLAAAHPIWLVAAHLDHGLDDGSGARALAAKRIARRLAVPFHQERRRPNAKRRAALGVEAAAREIRYRFLEEARRSSGCRYVLTAHHRDDQAETVLLRMLYGSGPLGLASIRPHHGTLLRPLLGWSRAQLEDTLTEAGLRGLEDPTNRDLARPRNRLRRVLRGQARLSAVDLPARLARLAEHARGAADLVDDLLEERLEPQAEFDGVSVGLHKMRDLPSPLLACAASLLHRRAQLTYPPSGASVAELRRQLVLGSRVGCDCGTNVRWECQGNRLHLRRAPVEPVPFTYTLKAPGEVEVKEISLRFRIFRSPVRPWMFRAHPRRAALAWVSGSGEPLTIRTRRAGDRIRPFGWTRSCRLKDLLINRKILRDRRDRLPLLCCGETIAWVPGVTIDDRYRITSQRRVWVAELDPVL